MEAVANADPRNQAEDPTAAGAGGAAANAQCEVKQLHALLPMCPITHDIPRAAVLSPQGIAYDWPAILHLCTMKLAEGQRPIWPSTRTGIDPTRITPGLMVADLVTQLTAQVARRAAKELVPEARAVWDSFLDELATWAREDTKALQTRPAQLAELTARFSQSARDRDRDRSLNYSPTEPNYWPVPDPLSPGPSYSPSHSPTSPGYSSHPGHTTQRTAEPDGPEGPAETQRTASTAEPARTERTAEPASTVEPERLARYAVLGYDVTLGAIANGQCIGKAVSWADGFVTIDPHVPGMPPTIAYQDLVQPFLAPKKGRTMIIEGPLAGQTGQVLGIDGDDAIVMMDHNLDIKLVKYSLCAQYTPSVAQ